MRLLIGSILGLLLLSSPVFGQLTEIRVDNSTMPGEDIAEVTINPAGQMVVTSISGVEYEIAEKIIAAGDVAISSFTINSSSSANLAVGASATIRWTTSNAVSCSASASPDSLNDWNSTTAIGTSGPVTVQFPEAGIFNLYLDCVGDNDSVDNAIITAKVGSATINSFEVTPTAANTGDNVTVTLDWTSSNATVGCFGSANWPNSTDLPASGSRQFDVVDIQPGTTFTLTCAGAFDEDVTTVAISVTDPAPNCDVTLTNGVTKDWLSVFKTAWPGPVQTQIRVTIPNSGYYAVKFNSGDVIDAGLLGNIEASGTSGTRFGALSEVPGCFDVAPECQHVWGRSGSVIWDTTGTDDRCELKPDTDYYWNMTFTDGVTPSTVTCSGYYCETILLVANPN